MDDNTQRAMGDLARARYVLHNARASAKTAVKDAKASARAAALAGLSETYIATALNVSRNTVRSWLGKPRAR